MKNGDKMKNGAGVIPCEAHLYRRDVYKRQVMTSETLVLYVPEEASVSVISHLNACLFYTSYLRFLPS